MTGMKLRNDPVWEARVDLAAALRWAVRYGLHEGICNHFSLQSPNDPGHFLINPQGLHWSEVKASDILVVDAGGKVVDGPHQVEPTAFFIHSRVHLGKPGARCVLHTHMPYATALTLLEGGRLEAASQNSLKFYGRIVYDDEYNGLALDATEGDRMCAKLKDADILFLASHGVIVTGPDVATALDDLYYLERACMNQVMASMTGGRLRRIAPDIAAMTRRQMDGEDAQARLHFQALKRMLDREEPDYRD
ncbi:MAG: aldolase [Alphaproteobacteria bacterium]|nr:aldolase [Alphaproteobacteria bacterium]